MTDVRLIIRPKNARVLRAMERASIETVADLCRQMLGSANAGKQSLVGAIVNFKDKPVSKSGKWRPLAIAIATALHCEPEELWPEHLQQVEMEHSEFSVDVSVRELGSTRFESGLLDKDVVKVLLDKLSPRHRSVLELRYGLNGNGVHTLKETGEIIGKATEQARQLEGQALYKMRRIVEETQ